METISYKLEHFEGPLDLLLHLVEKGKVNIYDIPIMDITAQYLDYVCRMKQEDLNVVSEFPVITATLLDIKAKMLLPEEMDEKGEEIGPRAGLVQRLLKYKRYRLMADELANREDRAQRHLYKPSTSSPEVAKYEPPVDLDRLLDGLTLIKLQRIFEQVVKRKEDKVDPTRNNFGTIKGELVSLEQKIGQLLTFAKGRRHLNFRQLLEGQGGRLEVVVTFLAVLELVKISKIQLRQKGTFGDMEIEALDRDDGDMDLDLEGMDDF